MPADIPVHAERGPTRPTPDSATWAVATLAALPMPIVVVLTVVLLPLPSAVTPTIRIWAACVVWLLVGLACTRTPPPGPRELGWGVVAGTCACLPWAALIADDLL
ncbi:hypothetical protein [Nocardioides sp. AE5]|uniref:hypothetical protein n=1 Tax=Nocardioides sp. AE5 TaxID=2962573 RepID=UPI002881C7AA|nr:hypothetical protein [Nocardioides sp. AE5]MDT0200899.1 hypothetical protein [Nocardioides sp. AE5]